MTGYIEPLHEASRALGPRTSVVLEQQLAVFIQHRRKCTCGVDTCQLLLAFIRSQAVDELCHVADFAVLLEVEHLIVLSQQIWQSAVTGLRCSRGHGTKHDQIVLRSPSEVGVIFARDECVFGKAPVGGPMLESQRSNVASVRAYVGTPSMEVGYTIGGAKIKLKSQRVEVLNKIDRLIPGRRTLVDFCADVVR